MKKINTLLLFLVSFISLMCTSCSFNGYHYYENSSQYLAGNQEYVGELDKIEICWTIGEVNLIQDENADKITITEENTLNEKLKVHSLYKGNVLQVEFCKAGLHFARVDKNDKKLTIRFKSVNELKINITSGDTNINNLKVDDFDYDQTSGNLSIGSIECREAELEQTSGNITIDNLKIDNLKIEQTSGKLNLKNSEVKYLSLDQTSGDSEIVLVSCENMFIESTSGDIDLTLLVSGATIFVDVTSGKVNCLRECKIENDKYIIGDGSCKISIEITSGNVSIN